MNTTLYLVVFSHIALFFYFFGAQADIIWIQFLFWCHFMLAEKPYDEVAYDNLLQRELLKACKERISCSDKGIENRQKSEDYIKTVKQRIAQTKEEIFKLGDEFYEEIQQDSGKVDSVKQKKLKDLKLRLDVDIQNVAFLEKVNGDFFGFVRVPTDEFPECEVLLKKKEKGELIMREMCVEIVSIMEARYLPEEELEEIVLKYAQKAREALFGPSDTQ